MTQEKFDEAMNLLTQIASIKSFLEENKKRPVKELTTRYGSIVFWLEEFKQDFIDFMGDELEKFEKDFKNV